MISCDNYKYKIINSLITITGKKIFFKYPLSDFEVHLLRLVNPSDGGCGRVSGELLLPLLLSQTGLCGDSQGRGEEGDLVVAGNIADTDRYPLKQFQP